MGKFVDLHILPPVDDRQSCGQMAELLRTVHYSDVALTLPTGLLRDRVKSVRQAFEQHNLKAYLRADLSPPSRTELLRVLRNFRATFDIIAVRCLNQRVATVACRDRRVDIIFFDLTNRNMRFTHSHARVLRGALELNFADLISQLGVLKSSQDNRGRGGASRWRCAFERSTRMPDDSESHRIKRLGNRPRNETGRIHQGRVIPTGNNCRDQSQETSARLY
jgi:hypothetical protein